MSHEEIFEYSEILLGYFSSLQQFVTQKFIQYLPLNISRPFCFCSCDLELDSWCSIKLLYNVSFFSPPSP